MQYPWYQAIYNTSDLQQGDFIPDCPIVVPPDTIKEGEKTEIEITSSLPGTFVTGFCQIFYAGRASSGYNDLAGGY